MRTRAAAAAPTPAEARFIEEVALMHEQMGMPRMAGRIFGWLLVCDPPQQSMPELVRVLEASKSTVSTMTRLLVQIGILRRVRLPGDRREYFALPVGAVPQMMAQKLAGVRAMRELAAEGLKAISGSRPERQARLREMHDLYAFLEREMPLMMARWEKESRRAGADARGSAHASSGSAAAGRRRSRGG